MIVVHKLTYILVYNKYSTFNNYSYGSLWFSGQQTVIKLTCQVELAVCSGVFNKIRRKVVEAHMGKFFPSNFLHIHWLTFIVSSNRCIDDVNAIG